jgi:tetratricopeptide (TPR) repeat protein
MRKPGNLWLAAGLILASIFLHGLLYADEKEAKEAFRRGFSLYEQGKLDEAIKAYTETIEKGAGTTYEPAAYHNRGIAYFTKTQYDEAIADYTKAIELNPKKAQFYYSRGNARSHMGQYDAAISDYSKALRLDPKYVDAYFNRGNAYLDKAQYDRAVVNFTNAIKIRPEYEVVYNNRGLAHWLKGQYEAAIADYTKAIQLKPKSARPYHNRGLVYFDKGEYHAAIADFDQAIQLDRNYADDASCGKGRALVKIGKLTEALFCHRRAISLCPGNPHYLVSKGFALEKMGKKKEAQDAYQRALRVNVEYYKGERKAWVIYGQALAYAQLGDKENCLKTLRSSIKLWPRLKDQAKREELLKEYWEDPDFKAIVE